jgi:hypothetical protein
MEYDLIKDFKIFEHNLGIIDMRIAFGEINENILDDIEKYHLEYFKYCEEVLSNKIYHDSSEIKPLYYKELGRLIVSIKKIMLEIEMCLIQKREDFSTTNEKLINNLYYDFLGRRQIFESFYIWAKIRIEDILGFDLEMLNSEKKIIGFNSTLQWKATQTDLVELVKALIENKAIEGTQTETLEMFCKILNFQVNNPDQKIQEIKTRKDHKPIFLERLKTSLLESF